MATLKPEYGPSSRPSEGVRSRRVGESSSLLNPPRVSSLARPKETEASRTRPQHLTPPRQSSRVPQPSNRRPSIPQSTVKSMPSHQAQPRTSGATAMNRLRANTRGGSGSSSSSHSIEYTVRPGPNVLRRKKSSLSSDITNTQGTTPRTSSSSSIPRSRNSLDPALGIHLDRGMTESPGEIKIAEVVEIQKPSAQSPVIYPELDRYRKVRRPSDAEDVHFEVPFRLATHDLPPPTPASLLLSGTSGSPSTRFSESPGPSTYSRDTTPTSICSQSPGLVASYRINQTKARLNSPSHTRPPVTRRRAGSTPNEVDAIAVDPHGLAAVRESLTSSSSNSTVREVERSIRDKKPSKRLPPPPPSPPPRKSSQKFRQKPDETSPQKPVRKVSRPAITSPSSDSNVKSPRSHTTLSPRATPPSRPSRDGTPDMHSQLFDPRPIIHSNLSTTSLPSERRGSEPAIQTAIPRSSDQLIRTERNASTSHLPLASEYGPNSRAATRMETKQSTVKKDPPRSTRTPSPQIGSTFNSRFLFFGRKKTTAEANQTDKKEKDKAKAGRKGPVAGTGHEGYGRAGAIRRRSGSISNFVRGSSGGQSSQETLSSHDQFLAERMNPVIIAGGEIVENRNNSSDLPRSDSHQSLGQDQPKSSSELPPSSRQASRNTLWPSAMERTPYPASALRRPSDSSDSEGVTMQSTLAFRRSMQRLRSSPDNPLRLPQPINTSGSTSSPMTSFDTSVMSDESPYETRQEVSRNKNPAHPAPRKLVKRSRSPRKWNLFSRSQNQPESKKNEKVAATVQVVEKKPVAFYMMDSSEQEDNEAMDVQEVLRSANVYGDLTSSDESPENGRDELTPRNMPQAISTSPRGNSMDQQRPLYTDVQPQVHEARPSTAPFTTKTALPVTGILSSGRPSRLPQVGRIPKVVSHRPENPLSKSFSRPFRNSLQFPPPPTTIRNVDAPARAPAVSKPSTPVPELTMEGSSMGSGTNISSSRDSVSGRFAKAGRVEKEFLAFSPRKNSEGTIGTSSSSCSGLYSFADATAIIPNPDDPPAEDEVWDEYDDLLGEDSQKQPASASSSKGAPFHLETYQTKLVKEKPMESPTIRLDDRKISTYSKATTRSSSYSADMTERIRTHFQPHPSPSTPFSVSEFVSGYERRDDNNSSNKEVSQKPKEKPSSIRSRKGRNSDASSSSDDDASPLAQVNLRVGSMTVSKWLTFGHVLFSDVRHDLVPVEGSLKRPSILVIDGLGNDDWSFYAAETYPAASFFNLSPRAPLPTELQNSPSSFPLSPPNHHQIQYVSHLEKFPFAPQSFTAVVYRFPVAAPEAYYRNILTETRRVLKPGGYIELSILDVDLNNMGNRGRRTVRRLKENIRETAPETNLASTADLIVRLLGKVGFLNIKAARVGVPVASSVSRSHDARRKSLDIAQKNKIQPSLAEMMSDNSPLADEGITKMVSRVGRWWYTRCYESAAESPEGKSIWNDKPLLRECEELGTSLKLMVCCARAPDRITSF